MVLAGRKATRNMGDAMAERCMVVSVVVAIYKENS